MLYHVEVYWPKKVRKNLPFGNRRVVYSNHARKASQSDRYGKINLPSVIDMNLAKIFEAEENGGVVKKITFRYPHCHSFDIVMACLVERGGLFVKTVWLNEVNDQHKTLDKGAYVNG